VEVLVTRSDENVLIIQAWFINRNNEFSIANVYALCDSGDSQMLWVRLDELIKNNRDDI
jgi:hypothetical protein